MKPSTRRGMSTAVVTVVLPSPAPTVRTLLSILTVLSVMAMTGCDVSFDAESGGPSLGEGEGEENGVPEVAPGACGDPVVGGDGAICGGCAFGGDRDICGVGDEAICEVRENSEGRSCQLCITVAGVVLYDDCFRSAVDVSVCESTPSPSADLACSTCFDDIGNALSEGCTPVADRCDANVVIGDRLCNQCYRDGTLVSTICAPLDLDPRRCVAYENDVGRCVDCYDDTDTLIAHDCGPTSDAGGVCEDRIQGGLLCTVCYDNFGQVGFQQCRDELPESARCERLEFSEQKCVMCADVDGDVVFVHCADNSCEVDSVCRADADCADNQVCFDGLCILRTGRDDGSEGSDNEPTLAACVAPPACVITRNDVGDLCRTCPTAAGTSETRCMSTSALTCSVLDEAALPPAANNVVNEGSAGISDPVARPAPQGRSCVLCTDRALDLEVYRDCDGNGAVPPPYCIDSSAVDGGTCSVCFDAISSDVVYSSCSDDICYGHVAVALHDGEGLPLTVDSESAVAACKQCSDGDTDSTSCALPSRCDDGITADVSACAATAVVRIQPQRCRNPWSAWRNSMTREDDLAGVMGFALSEHRLVIEAATATALATPPTCAVDSCSCARGDVIELVVADADRAIAERAFAALLAP